MSDRVCEGDFGNAKNEAQIPGAVARPIPKPRTKLPPDSKKLDAEHGQKEGSPTTSGSEIHSEKVPPPRPPPPRLSSKGSLQAPKLPPRPTLPAITPFVDVNKSPSPPPLPPRFGAFPSLPHPILPPMDPPNLLPFDSPVPASPSAKPPYPMEDRLPLHAPKIGWRSHWSSTDDPMEPLPEIPSGIVFRNDNKDLDNVVEKLPVNLVPDRPALPAHFESTRVPELISTNLHLDTPITIEKSTPPIDPVKKGYVEAVADDYVDYVENPIYLRLDSFLQRTFHDTSAKSHSVGYADSSAQIDVAVNLPYVNPPHPSTILPQRPINENSPAKSLLSPSNGFIPSTISPSSLNLMRPSSMILPEKNLPSLPRAPSSELSPGDQTPTLPPLPTTAGKSSESTDTLTPHDLSPSSLSDEDPPTPIAGGQTMFISNNQPPSTPITYPKLPQEINYRSGNSGINDMYSDINTDSFLPSEEDLAHSIEPAVCVDTENNPPSVDGTAVSYSGSAEFFAAKKDKKIAYIRLNHGRISVYDNEDGEINPIAGPFELFKAEFIGRQAETSTIVCRFLTETTDPKKVLKEKDMKKELRFTPDEHIEHWLLLLGQCWLSPWEDLRQSAAEGLIACGRIWLRQGTGHWTCAIAFLQNKLLNYLVQEHADVIYELDLRKVISIKGNLDQSHWCPHVANREKGKEKSGMGPFLISVEGGSVYIECDDASSVVLWRRLLETALMSSPFDLTECRLTYEDIPVHIDKCIRFVTTYGLTQEGLYRKNGRVAEAKKIRESLLQDPWEYRIANDSDETVLAVADVLRQILRQLTSPLFPIQFHEDFFNIYRMYSIGDERSVKKHKEYKELFQRSSFPLVNYSTIRRLIAHLCEVEQNSQHTKASVENLAKIFGPNLFSVESQGVYDTNAPLHLQRTRVEPSWVCYLEDDWHENPVDEPTIGVVADMMKGYAEIFDVTVRESTSRRRIDSMDIVARQHKKPAGNLLVSIHLWERDNQAFNVSSELVAEQVCAEATRRPGFDAPPDGSYAVFEVILNGALSRRLASHEKISSIVVGRWMQWKCNDGFLLFNHDTTQKDPTKSTFSGKVKVAEPGSKSFKSAELAIEEGIKISMYKNNKHIQTWPIDDTLWFVGVTASRKAPMSFSATFFVDTGSVIGERSGWVVSWSTLNERNHFMNAISRAQSRGVPPVLLRL
ncbi:unnamed protein product, partial [Mesorhabditis belari]|uniref:Rho-GAP domain-containing protein n=1 Tax=Mesorhabditis belari TaxID=2138241 RepID=A0AAF3E8L2_9BILA